MLGRRAAGRREPAFLHPGRQCVNVTQILGAPKRLISLVTSISLPLWFVVHEAIPAHLAAVRLGHEAVTITTTTTTTRDPQKGPPAE